MTLRITVLAAAFCLAAIHASAETKQLFVHPIVPLGKIHVTVYDLNSKKPDPVLKPTEMADGDAVYVDVEAGPNGDCDVRWVAATEDNPPRTTTKDEHTAVCQIFPKVGN